jgi:hypothetical protein
LAVRLFVTLRSVRHATHLTHFILFRDRAVWFTGSLLHF